MFYLEFPPGADYWFLIAELGWYCRKALLDFDALVKQSYSIHESFRLVRGGKVWTPAKVSPVGSRLRISTSSETFDILPIRVAWLGPNEFSVSGTDLERRPKRIVLRLQSGEQARAVVNLIPSLGRPVEVAGAPVVDWIPILLKFSYPRIIVTLSVLGLALWIVFAVEVAILYSFVGLIIVIWSLNLVLGILLRPIVSNFMKPISGSLRLEGQRLALTTPTSWSYPDVSNLKFVQSGAFVFKEGLKTVEVKFLTETDRTKALSWARMRPAT